MESLPQLSVNTLLFEVSFMKKIGWIGALIVGLMLVVAVVMAGQMGETSPAFARGRVILDDAVREQAQGADTLFVIMSGPDRPMPLGALRHKLTSEPSGVIYEFALTKESMQMMMGGGDVPETFKLKARLDRDGVAGPDQPGDLTGEILAVPRGSKGVDIRITRVVP